MPASLISATKLRPLSAMCSVRHRTRAQSPAPLPLQQKEAGLRQLSPSLSPQKHRPAGLCQPPSRSFALRTQPHRASRLHLFRLCPSAALDQSAAKTEAILALYNAEARRSLLRSNYCKVQTQFLLSLQDNSARLLLIPKPARVSALRAELTALNHKLPADVCFPVVVHG